MVVPQVTLKSISLMLLLTLAMVAGALAGSPPYVPQATYPADGAVDIPLYLDGSGGRLDWTGGDPDGDVILYHVLLGTSSPPAYYGASIYTQTPIMGLPLFPGETFYWTILAEAPDGSTQSDIFSFTTWDAFGAECGDVNYYQGIDISDLVYLVDYMFGGGPPPVPFYCLGDVNCDGTQDISDITYFVAWMFGGGPPFCEWCC